MENEYSSLQARVAAIMEEGRAQMGLLDSAAAHTCGIVVSTVSVIPHTVCGVVGLAHDIIRAVVGRVEGIVTGVTGSYAGAFNKAQLSYSPRTVISLAELVAVTENPERILKMIHISEEAFVKRLEKAQKKLQPSTAAAAPVPALVPAPV